MRSSFLFLISISTIILSCSEDGKKEYIPNVSKIVVKKNELSDQEFKTWYHKDIVEDTIPGVSLERAYRELLSGKKGEDVIVAVLDTKFDIHHEDLKQQLWVNPGEIPDNGIDDDKNGYTDDINGWDFLGNPKGEYMKYSHFEMVRVIKKYDALFIGKSEEQIVPKDSTAYALYRKAKSDYEYRLERTQGYIKRLMLRLENTPKAKKTMQRFFPDDNYTIAQLDSLIENHENDSLVKAHAQFMITNLRYYATPEVINNYLERAQKQLTTSLNIDFDERAAMGDDPEDLSDAYYGYNQVWGDVPFRHATMVAGVLGATRNNDLGVKGFSDHIRIMPVVMVATGDEHDKDVALAIRYAVDNGAKVINMSWVKDISLYEDWVLDAIRYAAEKDVVLVAGAGNNATDVDIQKMYPNDYKDNEEIVANFIKVGANGPDPSEEIITYFSCYGKQHVDVFAPGIDMYTTEHGNIYDLGGGTSAASPVVAGIAALIRSHYPELSAVQVKDIILQSGISYDIKTNIPGTDGKEQKSFSELSKSGKVVNAYNALLMAEKIVKKK